MAQLSLLRILLIALVGLFSTGYAFPQSMKQGTAVSVSRKLLQSEGSEPAEKNQDSENGDSENDGAESPKSGVNKAIDDARDKADESYSWWNKQSTGVKVAVVVGAVLVFAGVVSVLCCCCSCLRCCC